MKEHDDHDDRHNHDDHDEHTSTGDVHPGQPPRPRRIHTNLLRIIADDYDQAQRARVSKGEQIRAIAQGRDQQTGGQYLASLGFLPVTRNGKEVATAADVLLQAILRGQTDEPNDYLARAYRGAYAQEREAYKEMSVALDEHPAWVWMSQVRGVGPTLAAKLLSRLDLSRASTASSFWAYCGLITVPGQQWACATCGYVGIHPATYEITGKHKGCKQLAVKTAGPEAGVRAAKPKSAAGEQREYDAFAKKTMYLLASSWLKAGSKSFYNKMYREKVAFYERERSGWEKGRRHYSALRHAEKLFLSHLYTAWCEATGVVPAAPYAEAVLGHVTPGHNDIITPGDVLRWEEQARAGKVA